MQDGTSIIKRFHGILKDRINVIRSFNNIATAKLLTDGWLIHYNFFKEHTALDNVPSAKKMGITVPFKDWADIVRGSSPSSVLNVEPIRFTPITKPMTESQRRRALSRKANRKSWAKRKERFPHPRLMSMKMRPF